MTRVELAALKLATFLRVNSPPPDIAGTPGAAEWPVSITASEESAEELAALLTEQEHALIAAGHLEKP